MIKILKYENTLLVLNKNTMIERDYPIFNDDTALFILFSTKLNQRLYIEGLQKRDKLWIGNAYTYQESYNKNYGFKWLEDDSETHDPSYNREKEEVEYNKNTGYFLIDGEREIYGLSEKEIKERLNISSLDLKDPEKYLKNNGERLRLNQFNQDLFGKIFNIGVTYNSHFFEKENSKTSVRINKFIFMKNTMIIYLCIHLILCTAFLFKKNVRNIGKYVKTKEKRIFFLYLIDFLILFLYCFLSVICRLHEIIEFEKFILCYLIIKNFLLYQYLKLRKKKFIKLMLFSYFIFVTILAVQYFKVRSCFVYFYFISIMCFPLFSIKRKKRLKSTILLYSFYCSTQFIYLVFVLALYMMF